MHEHTPNACMLKQKKFQRSSSTLNWFQNKGREMDKES
jgi:hypothetical protein